MEEWYLEFPEWKEKNPDGTMSEWLDYKRPIVYNYLLKEYEERKDELSSDEQKEMEKELAEMKSRI